LAVGRQTGRQCTGLFVSWQADKAALLRTVWDCLGLLRAARFWASGPLSKKAASIVWGVIELAARGGPLSCGSLRPSVGRRAPQARLAGAWSSGVPVAGRKWASGQERVSLFIRGDTMGPLDTAHGRLERRFAIR